MLETVSWLSVFAALVSSSLAGPLVAWRGPKPADGEESVLGDGVGIAH